MIYVIAEVLPVEIERKQKLVPRRYWRLDQRMSYEGGIPTPYREQQSFDAFKSVKTNRCNSKTYPGAKGTILYHCKMLCDYQRDRECHRASIEKNQFFKEEADRQFWLNYYPHEDEIPLIDNVWEFYKIVGYDPKTKKWLGNDHVRTN